MLAVNRVDGSIFDVISYQLKLCINLNQSCGKVGNARLNLNLVILSNVDGFYLKTWQVMHAPCTLVAVLCLELCF